MKPVLISLALFTATCLGGDAPEPLEVNDEPADVVDAAPAAMQRAAEDAKRITKQVAEQAKHLAELARSKLAFAQAADAADASEPFEFQNAFDGGVFAFAGPRSATQPLIIRTDALEASAVSNIQEDLTVMSRVLTKSVEREVGKEGHDSAMGIVLSSLPGSKRPQCIYLQGYGALFLIQVKFPLMPAPAKDEEKADKAADSTWEQTKRELYGPRGNARVWNVPAGESNAEYDADQVDGLKKELLQALKNASNIRDLKPDESVTVAVLGTRADVSGRFKRVTRGNNTRKAELYALATDRAPARESTMTIRAKKSDVDAFAKGSIDFDEFKKRTSVSTY